MSRGNELVGSLTVAAAGTTSGLLSAVLSKGQMKALGSAVSLSIYSPETLAEAATVEVAAEYPGVNWRTLQDETGANVVPTADDTIHIPAPSFLDMRIVLGGAAAAGRTFQVMAKLDYAG